MASEVYLTAAGLEALQAELHTLSTTGRAEIAERIREAREFGDLSENAEYDAAKNDQARMEARIALISEKLRNAVVISSSESGVVSLGSRVSLRDERSGKEFEYVLVGSTEASPGEGRLSNESPVGRALLGHKKNDVVDVSLPNGKARQLKVTKIDVGL